MGLFSWKKTLPDVIDLRFMKDKIYIFVKNEMEWESQFILKNSDNFDSSQVNESIRKYLEYWGLWNEIEDNLTYSWDSNKEFSIKRIFEYVPFNRLMITKSFIAIDGIVISYIYDSVKIYWDEKIADDEEIQDKIKKLIQFYGGKLTGLVNLKDTLKTIGDDIIIFVNPKTLS